ncbi:MAG: EamA family transporter [Legionellaceae bacterium]|nr:EamA family transporter [Legionellaceae bacterium]
MPLTHLLLAVLVAVIWGINFIFLRMGLDEMSPLLLCATRFMLASIPAIFFIKPPAIPFRIVIWYGLIMFALQFALLFMGLYVGMTPGMASLVMQVQVFFSMIFAAIVLQERLNTPQILGACTAFVGIIIVAMHFDKDISVLGFVCVLAAAATWGMGNLITKTMHDINIVSLIVWSSFVAFIPMLLFAMWFDSPQTILSIYYHLSWQGIISLIYIVYLSTWVGYGLWNWLLTHHPVGIVVPFTFLVPIVGILSSVLFLGEPFYAWKFIAGMFVLTGLFIHWLSAYFTPTAETSSGEKFTE